MRQGATTVSGFRQLLVGRTLSVLGTCLIPTALTLAVIRATDSASDLGLVLACELIPQLALLPVGGVLADRLPPQRVAFVADLVRGLTQATIGVELLIGVVNILHLAVLSAIAGAAVAISTPTVSPLVAATVPEEVRLRANGHLGLARGFALVAGPGIVGALVVTVGVGWSFILTSLLFVSAALTLGGLQIAARDRAAQRPSLVADLREGWQEVRSHRWFWTNLIAHAGSNLTAGVLVTLGPLIAVRELGGEASWVVIYQCGMVGLVAGAYLAPRLPIRRPLVVTAIGGGAFALPMLAFAVPASIAVNAVAYFMAMVGVGLVNPLWQTVIQQRFKYHNLARADSYDALLSLATRPLGLALAAPVATFVGDQVVMLSAGTFVALVNLGLLALPDLRRITTGDGVGTNGYRHHDAREP
jgi:MFS family permease